MSNVHVIPARSAPSSRPRVAAYARVSTRTGRLPASLSAQVSHYSRLIQSTAGWEYAGVFTDEGITGTSTLKRTGFNELLDAARAGSIDLILTKSISRFARNTVDLLDTVRELRALGVSVRFERENIDTSTADGELLLTLLASFAQAESEAISTNVKWAIRKRYERGGTNSFHIYGYQWTGTGFTIIEDEATIVRRLFDDYLAGISPEKTAQALNDEGARSRGGGRFYGSVMRRMLENERYKGCQLLQKTYSPHIKSAHRLPNDGVLPAYWVQDALPAIITDEVFDAVQAEIAHRREIGPAATPSKNTGVFTGRIRCAACGKNYQRKSRHRSRLGTYRFWRCWSACKGAGNPCGGHNLRETVLEDACCLALNLTEFDAHTVARDVEAIEAHPNHLDFHLTNTRTVRIDLTDWGALA